MKLEITVGKSYINRFGDIVDIVEDDETEQWPLAGICRSNKSRLMYQRNGAWSITRNMEDLIKEHIENERTA